MYLQKFYRESIISNKTTGVQHIGMIVIIIVKGAAKCGFFPVQCAVTKIGFLRYLCYNIFNIVTATG
jgi:hypothetical protein